MSKYSRDELIRAFIAAMRAAQTANQMLDAAVADMLGLHGTAFRCLDILDQEGPMTAGQLAKRSARGRRRRSSTASRRRASPSGRATRPTAAASCWR